MKTYSFKITKTIKANRKKVYETWTNKKLAKLWAAPEHCKLTLFKSNFKEGGKFSTGMSTPHGPMKNHGVYLEIIPFKEITHTFVWEADDTEENLITIEFKSKGKDTQMVFTGSNFSIKAEAAGNKEGWASCLKKFAEVVKNA